MAVNLFRITLSRIVSFVLAYAAVTAKPSVPFASVKILRHNVINALKPAIAASFATLLFRRIRTTILVIGIMLATTLLIQKVVLRFARGVGQYD
jgi:hypothetical protein